MVEDANSKIVWIGGVLTMRDPKRKRTTGSFDDDLENDIAHFEAMSESDLNAYLAAKGIKTAETVDTVQKLVQAKLDEWRDRGLLHRQALVTRGAPEWCDRGLLHRNSLVARGAPERTKFCQTGRSSLSWQMQHGDPAPMKKFDENSHSPYAAA
jgi:hypothetical protein